MAEMDIVAEIKAIKERQARIERILIGLADATVETEANLSLKWDTKQLLLKLESDRLHDDR